MTRTRTTAALVLTALVALALSACAPTAPTATTSPAAGATSAPTATPTPTAVDPVKPASRYSVGCDDLLPASAIAPLFTHSLTQTPAGVDARKESSGEFPGTYYLDQLGGIDCAWTDGGTSDNNGQIVSLAVLPITDAVWKHVEETSPYSKPVTTIIQCSTDPQGCQYDTYVGGSWVSLELQNMTPKPAESGTVLPNQVKTLVTNLIGALSAAGAPGPAPAPAVGSVPLSNAPNAILTAAQVKAALGVKPAIKMDCSGTSDGPWQITAEASEEVDNSDGCFFAAGNTGAGYGLMEWLAGGSWAEKEAQSATPNEVAVSIPGLPAGDTAAGFTDGQNDEILDLVIGGNWVELQMLDPTSTGLPKGSVPLKTALVNLAEAVEKTVRG